MAGTRPMRILLAILGVLALVAGWLAWSLENEYGGNGAIEGQATGNLADGSVEIRHVDDPTGDVPLDYEVIDLGGGLFEVRWMDLGEGRSPVALTGTSSEVTAWREALGPQVFAGSSIEAAHAWQDEQRAQEKNYAVAWILLILGGALLASTVVPRPGRTGRLDRVAHTTT